MHTELVTQLKQLADFSFSGKEVVCSNYAVLNAEIPDERLVLESALYNLDDTAVIVERFAPYLGEYGICPIIEVFGGNVICVGYFEHNRGIIYYYDFDFGLFELDNTIGDFYCKLIDSDWSFG